MTMPKIRIPQITIENRKVFFWPAAFYIYLSYTFTGMHPFFVPWHPPLTVVDDVIPFLPDTVWIYLTHVVFMFSGWWWMRQGPGSTRAFWAMVFAAASATLFFFFFPTELPRRELTQIDAGPMTQAAWAFLLSADHPTNSFPSMHVAEAFITSVGLVRADPRFRMFSPVWVGAIALSTLTTEQHVLLDVLGGLMLGWVAVAFADRILVVVESQAVTDAAVN